MSKTTLISARAIATNAVHPAIYLQPGVATAVPDAAVADLLSQGATVAQEAAPEEAPKAAPKAAPKSAPKAADGE